MAAFLAGKLECEKNGRFGKEWLEKRWKFVAKKEKTAERKCWSRWKCKNIRPFFLEVQIPGNRQTCSAAICAKAIFKVWRWLPHRLSKCQSVTTVLPRTPIIQMIFFNQSMLLLGSNHFLVYYFFFTKALLVFVMTEIHFSTRNFS